LGKPQNEAFLLASEGAHGKKICIRKIYMWLYYILYTYFIFVVAYRSFKHGKWSLESSKTVHFATFTRLGYFFLNSFFHLYMPKPCWNGTGIHKWMQTVQFYIYHQYSNT
jgi:hypothetical protein